MNDTIKAKLNHLLADYAILYQKLRGFHWNVTGPHFFTLHEQFEKRYLKVEEMVDSIAERLRQLGVEPLTTLKQFLEETDLKEDPTVKQAETMVQHLVDDYVTLQKEVLDLGETADDAGDSVTADLMDELGHENGEAAWMFSAYLDKPTPLG